MAQIPPPELKLINTKQYLEVFHVQFVCMKSAVRYRRKPLEGVALDHNPLLEVARIAAQGIGFASISAESWRKRSNGELAPQAGARLSSRWPKIVSSDVLLNSGATRSGRLLEKFLVAASL